jgi:elongation factor Ts
MPSTEDIKKLRKLTGAGVMDSKNALADSDGDFDKAVELIKERGLAKADKKAERELKAGLIDAYVHNNRVGVLLNVSCETDFVARSDTFRELVHNVAMQIAAMDPESVEELLSQAYIKDEKETIEELVKGAIAKLGENIKVEEFTRYEI